MTQVIIRRMVAAISDYADGYQFGLSHDEQVISCDNHIIFSLLPVVDL
jgi:hypothetical protein